MNAEPRKVARATAVCNQDFIDIRTVSGHRMGLFDPEGKHFRLPNTAQDDEIGRAILECLDTSRFLSPDEAMELGLRVEDTYNNWVASAMKEYGYKNRRQMFREMRSCRFEREDRVITIVPSCHVKLEGWSGTGISEADYVKVSADAPFADIGAALRVGFSRCL